MQIETREFRREISIFDEMSKGGKIKTRKTRKIKRKYVIESIDKITMLEEKKKQKIQLIAQSIWIYQKLTKFFGDDKIFQDPQFYREIGKETINIKETPHGRSIENIFEK